MADGEIDQDGLQRLAPTGALAVGEPPVLVVAILRAAEAGRAPRAGASADDRSAAEVEAARAATRRAFPALSGDEVERALAVPLEDAAPTPPWPVTLGLALPLGFGALWCSFAGLSLFSGAFNVLAMPTLIDPRRPSWEVLGAGDLVVPLLFALAFAGLGIGLVGLRGWSRSLAWVLHALAGLACFVSGAASEHALAPLLLGLLCSGAAVGLRSAATRSWFTEPGRLALAATPWRAYVAGVAALHGVVTALGFVAWTVRLFYRIGPRVAPPSGTDLLLGIGEVSTLQPALVALAALLLPLPLLRLGPRHHRVAFLAIVLLGVVLLGSTLGAVAVDLLRAFGTL